MGKIVNMAVAAVMAVPTTGVSTAFADGAPEMCKPGSHSVCVPNKAPAKQVAPQRKAAVGCNVKGSLAAAAIEVASTDELIRNIQPRTISEQGFFSKGVVAGTFLETNYTVACINGQTQTSKSGRAFQAPVDTGAEWLGVFGTFLSGVGAAAGGIGIASGAMKTEVNQDMKVIIKKHKPPCHTCN